MAMSWTTTNAISALLTNTLLGFPYTQTAGTNVPITIPANAYGQYLFTLTGTNSAGATTSCTKTLTVTAVPSTGLQCSIRVNPTTVNAGGSFDVNWSSANATSGNVTNALGFPIYTGTTAGHKTLTLPAGTANGTYTFTFTITKDAGAVSKTCTAQLRVDPIPVTSCNLYVSPLYTQTGNTVQVSWNTNNAISSSITNTPNI
jgi:hypothetical protein